LAIRNFDRDTAVFVRSIINKDRKVYNINLRTVEKLWFTVWPEEADQRPSSSLSSSSSKCPSGYKIHPSPIFVGNGGAYPREKHT
jgi:hypothetical protein